MMTTITETISALLSHDVKVDVVILVFIVTTTLSMFLIINKYMLTDGAPIILAFFVALSVSLIFNIIIYSGLDVAFKTVHKGSYYVTASGLRNDAISCVGENSVNLCVVKGSDIEEELILISGGKLFFDLGDIKFSIVSQNEISGKPYFFIKNYDSNEIYAIPVTSIRHFKGVVNRASTIKQKEQEIENDRQKKLNERNAKASFTNSDK